MGDKKDLGPKNTSSWQQDDSDESSQSSTVLNDQAQHSAGNASSSSEALISQATKFLLDDNVRDAPLARKRSFLQSKGLSIDEVDRLLPLPKSPSSSAEAEVKDQIPESMLIATSRKESIKEPEHPSSDKPPAASREMAPIITYPEFLLHIRKPPPLITTRHVLASLHLAVGTGATVYGTSKFLISPMIDALNSARHSLLQTASRNVRLMNEKLEHSVSEVPAELTHEKVTFPNRRMSADDLDPAELFQRSIATQTNLEPPAAVRDTPAETEENTGLHVLHDQLGGLLASEATLLESSNSVKSKLNEFQHYLDNLAYGSFLMPKSHPKSSREDEILSIKAEIRGFKGVLLSARSFPSGAGIRAR